jgi:EmrB/QacA subfamily drug resistance transporter
MERRWWGLTAIALSMVVVGLDTTVLNVALPTLAVDLGASTGELQWVVDAYVLVLAALMLPVGALGDRYGRRRWLVGGLVVFGAASAVAAWADSTTTLIAARAVMGLGAAALTTLGLSIIPALFPPEERARAVGVATVGIFLGLPVGPLLGGWLLDHFWWGSIFLINVPIAALAAVGLLVLVPESRAAVARRVDATGGLLSMAGLAALVYGVIEVPQVGWTDPRTVAGLVGGAALLVVFGLVERATPEPMLDLRLFRERRFTVAAAALALVSVALFGLLFVIPQYLQVVAGHDAFDTGLRLLPMVLALAAGGGIADRVAGRYGQRAVIAVGLGVVAAGFGLGSLVDPDTPYGPLAAALAVLGFGFGLALPTSVDVVLGELPGDQAGAGVGVVTALRMVAGAFGVAVIPSVIAAGYDDRVAAAAAGLPDAAVAAATESVAGAAAVADRLGPAGDALRATAYGAFTDGMSLVLLGSAGVAVVAAVLVGAFMPARPAGEAPEEPRPAAELAA